MYKWLIGGLIGILVLTIIFVGAVVWRTRSARMAVINATPRPTPITQEVATESSLLKQQVDQILEDTNTPLVSESDLSLQQALVKISTLETSVRDLKEQLRIVQVQVAAQQSPGTTTSSVTKPPVYVPLGYSGSSPSLEWVTIPGFEVEIDTNEYAGQRAAYLAVQLSVYQGNGRAYARLYNITDNTAIFNSEVSTTNQANTSLISSSFSLASGKKKYQLQLKSSTSYAAQVQQANIKITF